MASALAATAALGFYVLPRAPLPAAAAPQSSVQPAIKTRVLPPEQQRAANEALTALKALDSVTQVGVTYGEYMRRLGDAKIKFDQVSDQIKDLEVRVSLEDAMDHYRGIGGVWNAKIQKGDVEGYLRIYAPGCVLIADLLRRGHFAPEVEGVQAMMSCAGQKMADASKLIDPDQKSTP